MANELAVLPKVEEIFLAARNSEEMGLSQGRLSDWLERKRLACEGEWRELKVSVEHAEKNKWAVVSLRSAGSRAKARVTFYEKLKAAVDAGYVILPWTWFDVFAVRVVRDAAKQITSGRSKYNQPDIPNQPCDVAPIGEGKYVSNESAGIHRSGPGEPENGKPTKLYFSEATDFKDVDFPVMAAKPSLMNATQSAMALKIFDEIGVAPNRRGKDPLILGCVKGPQGKKVTFLIAWYLDTRAL